MRTKKWFSGTFGIPYYQLRFADGGSGSGGEGDDKGDDKKDDSGKDDKDDDKKDDSGADEKKYSQADVDAAVESRLARERRKWEREHPAPKKKGEGDKKDQDKDEQPADDGSAAKLAAANQKLVQAEAKSVALTLGVKADRVAYAVRMADLSAIDVDDELGVDSEAVKKAMEQVLKDIPELKPTQEQQKKGAGFKVGGDGDSSGGDKKGSLKDAVAAFYKK
ncbi:hypothetical protein [Caproiciproducens sp.]